MEGARESSVYRRVSVGVQRAVILCSRLDSSVGIASLKNDSGDVVVRKGGFTAMFHLRLSSSSRQNEGS